MRVLPDPDSPRTFDYLSGLQYSCRHFCKLVPGMSDVHGDVGVNASLARVSRSSQDLLTTSFTCTPSMMDLGFRSYPLPGALPRDKTSYV